MRNNRCQMRYPNGYLIYQQRFPLFFITKIIFSPFFNLLDLTCFTPKKLFFICQPRFTLIQLLNSIFLQPHKIHFSSIPFQFLRISHFLHQPLLISYYIAGSAYLQYFFNQTYSFVLNIQWQVIVSFNLHILFSQWMM